MNIFEAIKKGDAILREIGIKSHKIDSEILMSRVIKKNRADIILNSKNELSQKDYNLYENLIIQRSKQKPIAHLTGKKEFWKYEFSVTKDVLIPRPDTEIIVEKTLKLTKNKNKLKVLEIGIGSGCILLSILKERKSFYGTGIDISKKTIEICKINCKNLGLSSRVKLLKTDIDNFRYGKYDLIISNPPYIKKFDLKYLEKEVSFYEPKPALDGGLDGLSELKKVILNSSKLIRRNGKLVLEIAFDQAESVKSILKQNEFYINEIIKDLSKKNRCIISTRK
ncbi:peptide chain release factor N(5)-glutamine methyltransferase [Candidatus Pelagibacter sp.]|nr:peptide chain release factor N(5)-glutamine methyltransferase [Candidatus Pelagibacter sp.]